MAGDFFDSFKVVAFAKKSENKKGKKKKRRGEKGNKEEFKRPSDGIYDAAGTMIRSFHLSSQLG